MVWKVLGAWIDGYFLSIIPASLRLEHYARYNSENKDKALPLQKIRVCYFFRAVYHSKKHVISNCFIAGILNILQREKTTNFPNTTENYLKIVTYCEFDFRLNFALNGGHLGHHL